MKNKKLLSRTMSIALTLLMAVSLVLVYALEANAASSGKLMKTVVRYYREPGSKWKKMEKIEYTYNSRKDPIQLVDTYRTGMKTNTEAVDTYLREYTYKNGKKVECKEYALDTNGNKTKPAITKYDSKGRPTKISSDDEDNPYVIRYTYGKNGYIKTKKKTEDGFRRSFTFKYKWNGKKPKSIKATDGGKYVEAESKFNKKGFYAGILYTQSPYGRTETVTYKFKNGLVSTINVKVKDGKLVYYQKYKITYTKTKIPADRYCKMINSVANYTVEGYNNEFWY